jgi:AcrR family transcriptional regulator
MSEAVTMAAFARMRGVNKGTVTRWREQGRIIMDGGKVDVVASERQLAETGGARPDVAERHARKRNGEEVDKDAPDLGPGGYQAARAMNEHYKALRAKAEYEQMIGNLLARDDVDAAMRNIGAAVRAALDVLPDQTAPLVGPVTDLHEVHTLLSDACRNVLRGLGETLARVGRDMGGKE